MKNIFLIIISVLIGGSCVLVTKPSGFTNLYTGRYIGLDTLIEIDGLYFDSIDRYVILLYRDGLSISIGVDTKNDFDIFKKGSFWSTMMLRGGDNVYGSYILRDDSIIVQTLNRDISYSPWINQDIYKIASNNALLSTKNGHLYKFYPLENRMDSINHYLKRKWFWQKEAWESRDKK